MNVRLSRPLIVVSVLACAAAALALAVSIYPPYWHPSDRLYPRQGIDVSHHQGLIDWASLPSQGVDFAYIKATEGGDFKDRRFRDNWRQSKAAGVRRGAYHFFTLCRSGHDQAQNFIATVPRESDALPPAVDLEFMGNCGGGRALALEVELATFLRMVESYYGQSALLYLTDEFDEAFGATRRFNRPVWLRSILWRPSFGARPWCLWQASNFRRLKGIRGRVDWNVQDDRTCRIAR